MFQEGSAYGRYQAGYATVPLLTAKLLGREVFGETNWWKSAVLYLIYATTPGPTYGRGYDVFPFCDDSFWRNGKSAASVMYGSNPGSYHGDLMQT